jgi:hypothetical protein
LFYLVINFTVPALTEFSVISTKSVLCLLLALLLVAADKPPVYREIDQQCFGRGERMDYRIHYGFVNAGEAVMRVDETIHRLSGRPCYKVEVFGRTTGFFDLIMHVRDVWGSYIDTSAIVSHQFFQDIEEGKYRKKEVIDFDHRHNIAQVHRLDKESGALREKVNFDVPDHIQDIVSGYYYIRTLNFDTMQANQVFEIVGFYDDTTYTVPIRYLGKEQLKTKLGDYSSIVMSPIMPKNTFFRGRNPVKAWLSDDQHKVPLKVKAELLIGSVEIDIKSFVTGQ